MAAPPPHHDPASSSDAFSMLSTSDDDGDDNAEHSQNIQRMSQTYRIRLQAANLPVATGLFRGSRAPDTFAIVTSTSQPTSSSTLPYLISPEKQPIDINETVRLSSTPASPNSSVCSSISIGSNRKASPVVWGQTEVVHKSRNPSWTHAIKIEYVTGSNTYFYVHIFQHSGSTSTKSTTEEDAAPKCLGTALFHVDDMLSTKNTTRCKRLRNGGCVFCRLEAVRSNTHVSKTVHLILQATNLVVPKKSMFSPRKVDTVMEIAKRGEPSGWIVVHRSNVVEDSLDPTYDDVYINLEDLCGSNLDRHLRLYVYSVNGRGKRQTLIGLSETNVRHILLQDSERLIHSNASSSRDDTDANPSVASDTPHRMIELQLQRNSGKMKEVGRLCFHKASIIAENGSPVHIKDDQQFDSVVEIVDLMELSPLAAPTIPVGLSFASYVERGCNIDFCVAIDFTSSNGDPTRVGSYHYQSENSMNDYEETIYAIGQALARYSSSQEYAVWGFGAKFGNVARHIFQCGPTPTVQGVDGILGAYRSMFQSDLIMSGPTDFTQVLQAAAARAKRNHDAMRESLRYTVLLIVTDGIMYNFDETRQRIDLYSTMPLSVIFVGIGSSDFAMIQQLCSDNDIRRNITTFVTFRQHQYEPSALGEASLRNIPLQLCQYMQAQGI